MTPMTWKPIDAADPERFEKARYQVHSAVQWLARLSCSYGEAQPSLVWNAARRAVSTGPLDGALDRALGMELTLPAMILQFTEHGVPVRHDFELEGHTQAHVEAWILVELLHRGVDRERFSKALPYDVSALMKGDVIEFAPEAYGPELEALAGWYENALSIMAPNPTAPDMAPNTMAPDMAPNTMVPDLAPNPMVQEWADAVICPEDLALERIAGGVRSGFSPGLAPSGRPGFFVTAAADARGLPPRAALPIEALPPGQAGAAAANGFLQRVPEPAHPL